jgi:hypothetical protein
MIHQSGHYHSRLAAVHSVSRSSLCRPVCTEEQNAISFVETLSQRLGGKGSSGVGNGAAPAPNGGNGDYVNGNGPRQPDEEQPAPPVDSPFELRALEVALEMVRFSAPPFVEAVYSGLDQCISGVCTSMSVMVRTGALDVADLPLRSTA